MSESNPSFVLRCVNDVVFEDRPVPQISDDSVLVQVFKTGICGSDIHYLVEGRIGDFVVKSPMVLGHESSGVVAKVGAKVKNLKVGDRVALEPGRACAVCDLCKSGRYQLCPYVTFAATPPYDGTLCRYFPIPAHLAYLLPENVSLEEGAMVEPLSVAIHSVHRLGGLSTNQSIAVLGCGPIGLVCMAVAKALGASRIIAVDILQSRLEFAKGYAATEVYLPLSRDHAECNVGYAKRNALNMKTELSIEDYGPRAIDLVIEASGAGVSVQTGIQIVKKGGTFIQVGMGTSDVTLDVSQLITKEVTYKGSFRYGPGDYRLAIALVSQGKIDLKPLVTHRYRFEDCVDAFAAQSGQGEDGKPVIKVIISGPDIPIESV